MSSKGKLTREQAVALVGEIAVAHVERLPCEATSRLQTDGDDRVEFAACVKTKDADGNPCYLSAYYYIAREDLDACDARGARGADLSDLDWIIAGYAVQ